MPPTSAHARASAPPCRDSSAGRVERRFETMKLFRVRAHRTGRTSHRAFPDAVFASDSPTDTDAQRENFAAHLLARSSSPGRWRHRGSADADCRRLHERRSPPPARTAPTAFSWRATLLRAARGGAVHAVVIGRETRRPPGIRAAVATSAPVASSRERAYFGRLLRAHQPQHLRACSSTSSCVPSSSHQQNGRSVRRIARADERLRGRDPRARPSFEPRRE